MFVSTRENGYAIAKIRKKKISRTVVQFDVTRIWYGIRNVNSNEKCLRESKLIALVMNVCGKEKARSPMESRTHKPAMHRRRGRIWDFGCRGICDVLCANESGMR